ncbi:YciI family protein [Devosia sp.]|uniref:YciI family protein n=1 Tax=Devosia sp. TaxID=1871048 RepID=UPI003A9294E2
MPFYSIVAKDKSGALDQRMAVRPEHLKHLETLGDRLIIAGPFQNEEGKATGSFMVIEADDLATATSLFEQDPFIKQGVFESWDISRWGLTINNSAGR